jgi:hypothetical protein
MERGLDRYDGGALLLDGKTFAEDAMVAAVGITITGEQALLGFVQTATENRKVCAACLRELVERGLRTDLGLLVVTGGAKGLHAAVREVCGTTALLQRWLATALLDLEPRLRRIKNLRLLPLLRAALTRQIEGMKTSAA